ncbi:MAG: ABC transporter substrate-binding protein [Arcobacter sp.]|nr:MAG: ABC transporter substrate-binding protein [Arcobacter sp.]
MIKKIVLLVSFVCLTINLNAKEKLDKLVLAGPSASISHPFFRMIETGALNDMAKNVEFKLWRTPAQLKAMIINKSADFIAVPTNVAAIFYNKGQDIKLLNVSIWGLMSILSRDKSIKSIKDLKGKSIVVPFRNDVPDTTFKALLDKEGIDAKKDIKIKYTTNIVDAMSLLVTKIDDTAFMLEPISSMALLKDKSLNRSIDIQKEWAKLFKKSDEIAQAGIVATSNVNKNKKLVARFLEEYGKAIKWYKENPNKAGKLVGENLKMLNSKAVAKSIPFVRFKNVPIAQAKEELEFFFRLLEKEEPKNIGGKLPDSGFYF